MSAEFEIDLTGMDTTEKVEAGERVPPGWYDAILTDYFENPQEADEWKLEFTIQAGDYENKKLFYTFTSPNHEKLSGEESKQTRAVNRIRMLASRLGLISSEHHGKPGVRINFNEAVTKQTRAIVNVVNRPFKGNDGQMIDWMEIGYEGVYPADHPKIPEDVRKSMNLGPAREGKKTDTAGTGTSSSNGNGSSAGAAPPDTAKKERARKQVAGL